MTYAHLKNVSKHNSELSYRQTELLEQKVKDLDFKKGNLPYNNSSASILQFILPFDYKGTLVFKLIDLKNRVNYISKDLDLLTDHYQKLEELGQNKEWYNVPMKGLELFVIGNYIKQKKLYSQSKSECFNAVFKFDDVGSVRAESSKNRKSHLQIKAQ